MSALITPTSVTLGLSNPFANTTYYWQVIASLENGGKVYSSIYSFTTADTIRTVTIDGVSNTRDIGGYETEFGYIKQGLVYRSARLESITETEDLCKYRQELTSTGDVITTVSQNPGAIGYASVASVKDTVKAVTVDGIAVTEETILDGSYVVQRPFVLVTMAGTELSEAAQNFFDYITSDEVKEIILDAGVVPAK